MIDRRQHVIGKLYGYDFEEITINGTAIGLDTTIIDAKPEPKEVFIMIETADCRYRYDGEDPTASSGFLLRSLDTLRIKGTTSLRNLKFIKKGLISAKATVCYER